MKNLIIVFLILKFSGSFGQGLIDLPIGFKDSAYKHVKQLEGFGIRSVGLKGEIETIKYLDEYFTSLKLKAVVDTFDFQCYNANQISFFMNKCKVDYNSIYINPYKDSAELNGSSYFFNPDSGYNAIIGDSIYNKIILTKKIASVYRLYEYKPLAIVILNDSSFNNFNKKKNSCLIRLIGNINIYKSYNIYCSLDNKSKKEILIGAHWDSFNGPGADDNASGVSVVLELARFFNTRKSELPFNVKFVLFGAEELGLLGSKAYTQKHIIDTCSTIFYFNIDCVGDTGEILVDMTHGVTWTKDKQPFYKNSIDKKASRDFSDNWSLLDTDLYSIPLESNVPLWLQNILTEVLDSSNHEFIKLGNLGSDHRSFSNLGFAATHIGMGGDNLQHCPQDQINQVNKNSLELIGKIVATTVLKTMENKKYE
ncbi:MAG: Zn-dependent exopeptidase M28 [Bacteroidetes bacterium]|nr:Zn-dependent exopeptidase M28 [Bacteroidota bacterium]